MSCRDCEMMPLSASYSYRWKAANVVLIACRQHAKEIMDVLNAYQRKGGDNPGSDAPNAPGEGT